jgi:hypothetical protein
MPPKKEKKEERAPVVEDPEVEDGALEIQERELVISHLKTTLGAFQDRGATLASENQALEDAVAKERVNLQDINEYLTNELRAKQLAIQQLQALVATYEGELGTESATFEHNVETGAAANAAELDRLKDKLAVFDADAERLQELRENKVRILTGLDQVSATLFEEQRNHEENVNDLERLAVQEKDRLKKEMALKIKETNLSLMKLTDNQLEITTKRTIMENEQMSGDLATVSRSTEKLITKNEELIQEHAAMRISLELSKQMGSDLEKRSRAYQRTIKSLLHRLKENEESRRVSERDRNVKHDDIDETVTELSELQREIAERTGELDYVLMEREDRRGELDVFRRTQDETSNFLVNCLSEVKHQIITVVGGDGDDGGDGGGDGDDRDEASIAGREGNGYEEDMEDEGGDGEGKGRGNRDIDVRVIRGQLEELSSDQRERALGYLLEKLHHHQASRQQRLLGLGRPAEGSLVLPPIDQTSSGMLGAVTGANLGVSGFASGGVGMMANAASQTNDERIIARGWAADGKAAVRGTVGGELRPWGQKLDLGAGGIRKHIHMGKRYPLAKHLPPERQTSTSK